MKPEWEKGNESVPKIIIGGLNSAINLFLKLYSVFQTITASEWVLFGKIASVYFIWKIYLYFSIGNGQSSELALFQLYRRTVVPCCLHALNVLHLVSCGHTRKHSIFFTRTCQKQTKITCVTKTLTLVTCAYTEHRVVDVGPYSSYG